MRNSFVLVCVAVVSFYLGTIQFSFDTQQYSKLSTSLKSTYPTWNSLSESISTISCTQTTHLGKIRTEVGNVLMMCQRRG